MELTKYHLLSVYASYQCRSYNEAGGGRSLFLLEEMLFHNNSVMYVFNITKIKHYTIYIVIQVY